MLSNSEKKKILGLAKRGDMNKCEIAKRLGLKASSVSYFLRINGYPGIIGPSGCPRKYSEDMIEKAFVFFQEHSFSDTAKHMNLKQNELKSLITYGYKIEKFSHLRKTPRHMIRSFTLSEKIMVLRYVGILSRSDIARLIKRTVESVKAEFSRIGMTRSSFFNGLPVTKATLLFPDLFTDQDVLISRAGPNIMKFKIILWKLVWERIRYIKSVDPLLKKQVFVMKTYQEFIWENKSVKQITNSMKWRLKNAEKFRVKEKVRGVKIVHSN